ncbi:polysaccharide deacetylase family protein [Rhizobium sp. LjRoot30]|uniref:polysaccharide deacetylase family protein n=1 Tax=Rhizobium sp. LjRoot30 TaxID=3342320 RepID=UPI003F4F43C0
MRLAVVSMLSLFVAVPAAMAAERSANALVEPQLQLAGKGQAGTVRVALTFDACMGKTDFRILSALIDEKIPATLFVTARWLRHNPEVVAVIRQHPDLFEIENHGRNHVPAVDRQTKIYGIAAAGSPQAVADEVAGGEEAIVAAGLAKPHWFRGATAKYTPSAIADVRKMGYEIAGYSVNGDGGSLLGAAQAAKRIAAARDGDVVIAHINQPTHAAGEGVVKGILALKARGVTFVRLADVPEIGTN